MSTNFKLNKTVNLYNLTYWPALLHTVSLFLFSFLFFLDSVCRYRLSYIIHYRKIKLTKIVKKKQISLIK